MISVIIPARNAAATIGATLSSLAADKALIGEILLIDDGSDDDTVSKAEEAAHNHALPLKVTSVQFGKRRRGAKCRACPGPRRSHFYPGRRR